MRLWRILFPRIFEIFYLGLLLLTSFPLFSAHKFYLIRNGNFRLWVNALPANISTLFQRCLLVDMTSRRRTTSNQRWNNVVYLNVGIYNVEQRRINVAYFNVDVNNVRQRRNNVVLFNVEFYNVGQRGNNVVKMTISKKNKKKSFQINTLNSKF